MSMETWTEGSAPEVPEGTKVLLGTGLEAIHVTFCQRILLNYFCLRNEN